MGKRKGEAAKTKTETEIRAGSDRYRMVLRPMNQWEYMRAESPRAVREAAVSTFKGVLLAGVLFGGMAISRQAKLFEVANAVPFRLAVAT